MKPVSATESKRQKKLPKETDVRKLLWLIPLFFLTPTLVSVLDLYALFVLGAGFLPHADCDTLVPRVLTLLFSGFLGIVATAYVVDK